MSQRSFHGRASRGSPESESLQRIEPLRLIHCWFAFRRPKSSSDVFVSYAQCSVFKEQSVFLFFSAARGDLYNIPQRPIGLQQVFYSKTRFFLLIFSTAFADLFDRPRGARSNLTHATSRVNCLRQHFSQKLIFHRIPYFLTLSGLLPNELRPAASIATPAPDRCPAPLAEQRFQS